MISNTQYGPEPMTMTCPHCQSSITTRIDKTANTKTHLVALLLCALVLWPCVPCVYFTDSCLVKKHYCPNCNQFLGMLDN